MKILSHEYVLLSNLLLIISIAATINAEYDEADYMSDLLKALKPTPTGWSNKTHHCKWKGISCDSSRSVTSIMLPSSSLTGTLPPNINTLTNLTHIDLHNNSLNGPLPYFSFLVLLQSVSLGHNNFDSYPSLEYLPVLRTLNLSNNLNLSNWLFPMDDIGGSRYLETLDLEATNMIGSIPDSLKTLPLLQLLDVSNNNLSGVIPKFSSKVKLNVTGNAFLVQNMSRQGGVVQTRDSSKAKPRPVIWIAGASMIIVGVGILIALIICKRKRYHILVKRWVFKKMKKSIDHNVEDFIQSYNLLVPIKQYRYSEVKRITYSFRDKLGQGGYGVVYKASLPDGRPVAVKVINESKGNGEEFINEVASISRTSHVNIVSLLGFCYDNKRALIYEFMSKGSLDKFIIKRGSPNAICSLDWNTMYQIAIGIARGLEYLHQGCISRILHLDIKPQNILLDEDFCPKISDFGLAKICQRKDSIVSMIGTRGTIGYIAPEVFSRIYGGVSHKSDVYSYGMLVLEMIEGRKNYDSGGSCTSEMYFPDWIYKDLEQGNNLENCLANSDEENDMVRQITMVSLWCIQMNPSDRPSMSKVLEMLQGPLQSVSYPPKPFLHSPEGPLLQTSFVSSSNLLETNSIETSVKI